MRKRLGTMIATAAAVLVGFGMTVPAVPTAAVEIGSAAAVPASVLPAIPVASADGSGAGARIPLCSMSAWAGGGLVTSFDCDQEDLETECGECIGAIFGGGDWVAECLECAAELWRCMA